MRIEHETCTNECSLHAKNIYFLQTICNSCCLKKFFQGSLALQAHWPHDSHKWVQSYNFTLKHLSLTHVHFLIQNIVVEVDNCKQREMMFILFVSTAKTYPSFYKINEDKQFFWHRRLLYTNGSLYSLVGKLYIFSLYYCSKNVTFWSENFQEKTLVPLYCSLPCHWHPTIFFYRKGKKFKESSSDPILTSFCLILLDSARRQTLQTYLHFLIGWKLYSCVAYTVYYGFHYCPLGIWTLPWESIFSSNVCSTFVNLWSSV